MPTTENPIKKSSPSKMGRNPFQQKSSGVSRLGKVLATEPVSRRVKPAKNVSPPQPESNRQSLWTRGETLAGRAAWYVFFARGVVIEFSRKWSQA